MFFKMAPSTKRKWNRFKKIKRGYYSLIALVILYVVSLFANFIANNKPLIVHYQNEYKFPILFYYSDEELGGDYLTEAQYKQLAKKPHFAEGNADGNYMIFPPVPYGENEAIEGLTETPPTAPDSQNLMGTDDRGRDLLTRIIYGFRVSITFGLVILLIEIVVGTFIGSMQGYFGGYVDLTMQRVVEMMVSIPFLYVVILVAHLFTPSFLLLFIVFGVFNWITMGVFIRGEFLRGRKKEYVLAAKAIGVNPLKIIFRHILPNSLTPIVTLAPFIVATSIISLSTLDFLGFGVPAPTASWGEILSQARSNLSSYHLSLFPIVALFGTLVLINFVGEAVREAFDPREYFRYKG